MIEIYEAKDGFRFRVKSGNGKILCHSEAYGGKDRSDSYRGAIRGAKALCNAMDKAKGTVKIKTPYDGIITN